MSEEHLVQESETPAAASYGDAERGDQFQEIDLWALAREVYALLKRELRLENERMGRSRRW